MEKTFELTTLTMMALGIPIGAVLTSFNDEKREQRPSIVTFRRRASILERRR